MKPLLKSAWYPIAGLLLALPAAYVIYISVLKYELNVSGPFESAQPILERWGIKEPLGWNINLLIFLGPVVGFLLAIFQVLAIKWHLGKEEINVQFALQRRWFPIVVSAFCCSQVAILFLYMVGENCR